MQDVLIVVDMQNDFITGSLGTPEAQAIVPNVANKVKAYRYADNQVFFTRDTHFKNIYSDSHEGRYLPIMHCIASTDGWEVVDTVEDEAPDNALYIPKISFGRPSWCDLISNKESIEIIGLCTDICVISNALILRSQFPESEITVDASCCAGTTPEKHRAALEVMKSCHIDVINE